ncbi:MAG: PilZ domain-containing protein [Pseudomonadales bacterium]
MTKIERPERVEKEEELIVDVVQCQQQPELNAASMACRTLDVSEKGMKVSSYLPIPANSRLTLRLDTDSEVYRLEGEVRWGREQDQYEDHYYAGLLLDDDSPDFDAWTKRFQSNS